MLELKAFGSISLSGDSSVTQPKRLALLAYLGLARPRGYHRRDTLLALLWPELDQARGRKALSQSLFYLRRALPDEILLTRGAEEVGIDHQRVRCDVLEFEQALEREEWAKALELYRGELLAGLHVTDAPAFEEWLYLERDRLRELAGGAGWSLATELMEAGNLVGAERTAHRALRLVPTDETSARGFIRTLAAAGARASALRFYEKLRVELARMLEVDPAPATAALAAALRANRAEPSAPREISSREDVELPGSSPSATASEEDHRSLAVLPFSNLSADPEHAFFADGITDDIMAHLAGIRTLRVTSRRSVLRYRGTTQPIPQIAAELGVGAVLEGTVRVTGERVRVVAQLIDAESDTYLWTETYDRSLDNVLGVQNEVATAVGRALEAELGDAPMTEAREASSNRSRAYALWLKGMGAFESGLPEDYARGLTRFEAALRIAPDYARAHAGLALLLAAFPTLTHQVPDRYDERLREAAGRALELDPSSSHAWIARAYYLWTRERDWLGAEEAMGRALALGPGDPHILLLAAEYYRLLGRLDEASRCLDRLNGMRWEISYAQVLRAGVELSRAEQGELDADTPVRRLDGVIARHPADGLAHLWRAIAMASADRWTENVESDRRAEILRSVDTSLQINPDIPLAHGFRGAMLGRWGRTGEAREEEEWFREERDGVLADPFSWGLLRFGRGDLEGGFRLMEEGVYRRPSFLLPGFRLMRVFRPYWEDSRFTAIMDGLWPGRHKKVLGPYGWQPGGGD